MHSKFRICAVGQMRVPDYVGTVFWNGAQDEVFVGDSRGIRLDAPTDCVRELIGGAALTSVRSCAEAVRLMDKLAADIPTIFLRLKKVCSYVVEIYDEPEKESQFDSNAILDEETA